MAIICLKMPFVFNSVSDVPSVNVRVYLFHCISLQEGNHGRTYDPWLIHADISTDQCCLEIAARQRKHTGHSQKGRSQKGHSQNGYAVLKGSR